MADEIDGAAAESAANPSEQTATATETAAQQQATQTATQATQAAQAAQGRQTQQRQVTATATDGGQQQQRTEAAPAWPDNWRERMANGDAKELKRLQRFTDPSAIYGSFREMEARFGQGGLIKAPGPKATPEEKAAFHKALGVPEKPEAYLEKIALSDGKVLGDADKPIAEAFAKAIHPAGATQEVVSAAVDWYLGHQEQQAAAQYDQDVAFKNEGTDALKGEWGSSFNSNINAIPTLFGKAPGGANPNDEAGVMFRLLNGRTADGKVIGNDPDVLRWLASTALEVNPFATVVPVSADQAKAASDRLAELRKLSGKQDSEYWVGPKAKGLQEEFQKLLEAEQRAKSRAAAA